MLWTSTSCVCEVHALSTCFTMYLQHDSLDSQQMYQQHAGRDDIVHTCEWRVITVHVTLEEGQAGSVAHTHLAARRM